MLDFQITTYQTYTASKISFIQWFKTSENDATVFTIFVLPLQLYLGRRI